MNSRKRPAAEPLLPFHASKQPRTKMVGYDGGNPSASEEAGLLSRWMRLGLDFKNIAVDTFKVIFLFGGSSSSNRHTHPMNADVQQHGSPLVHDTLPGQSDLHSTTQHLPGAPSGYPLGSPQDIQPLDTHNLTSTLLITPPATQCSTDSTSPQKSSIDVVPASLGKHGGGTVTRRYRNRKHIYAKEHKANVLAERLRLRDKIQRDIYNIERRRGYASTFSDFKSFLAYKARLEKVDRQDVFSGSFSMADLHSKEAMAPRRQRSYSDADQDDDLEFLRRAFEKARATLNEPRPPHPFQPALDILRLSQRVKDEMIDQKLHPKRVPPAPLPAEADSQVDAILAKSGVVSKFAKEQVSHNDLARLRPQQWLNDEIINFYGALILARSDDCKENAAQGVNGKKFLNVHYFSSFFWLKLKEGYDKSRLAKWTKKIDLFSKDVVLVPVNHSNAHWTGAAINFRQKRIESYDSMGTRRDVVFKLLRSYLDSEHQNKKKRPFDFTGWEDYSIEEPQQENGYDCGVFTCQFLQGLSRGEERITFTQKDMPHLRRRMIWEIGNAKLRDDP